MIELVVIGVLVSLSILSLGMSVDFARGGSENERTEAVADPHDLDLDLTGGAQGQKELESDAQRTVVMEPVPLSESDMEELTQELEAIDVRQLDYDLSGMAEEGVLH